MEIIPMHIPFCWDFACVYYFYVSWLIMTSQ